MREFLPFPSMEKSSSSPSKGGIATAALAGILGVGGLVGYNVYDNHLDSRERETLRKLVDDQRRDYGALLERVNVLDNELTVDELHNVIEQARCSLVAIGPINNPASGFFINDCHFIVTNHHVTDGLTQWGMAKNGQFPITLHSGNRGEEPFTFFATIEQAGGKGTPLQGASSSYQGGSDITILRVPEHVRAQLPSWVRSMELRDTGVNPIRSGEVAIVVGNPRGQRSSINVGRVSHGERHFDIGYDGPNPLYPVVQVDADMNSGNSGGMTVDSQGRLLGISFYGYGPGLNHARHVLNLKAILKSYGLPVTISPQEQAMLDRWQREHAAIIARQEAARQEAEAERLRREAEKKGP